jgi:site-specific DNA-cytosine methylase
MTAVIGTVYLLHFDRPYKHARHYLGWAESLDARLAVHGTTQREKVRQYGNAVTPPVAEVLIRALAEAITGTSIEAA